MIECSDLCLSFEGRVILNKISFSFPDSGVFALMGPSGAGKSSLLKILSGLLTADSGSIRGLGNKRVGILFQEDRLLPWHSALKNVMLAMECPSQAEAQSLLNALEMADAADAHPAVLSGGMKRRIALARAIAFSPDILLLDEPFSGIDEQMKRRIIPFIRKSAPLIIFATHDLKDADMMGAMNILTLRDGTLSKNMNDDS